MILLFISGPKDSQEVFILTMRLDKYLANSHEGSRSEVKEHIKKGRVSVNGAVIKDAAYHVSPVLHGNTI